jgi:hypothetical protein
MSNCGKVTHPRNRRKTRVKMLLKCFLTNRTYVEISNLYTSAADLPSCPSRTQATSSFSSAACPWGAEACRNHCYYCLFPAGSASFRPLKSVLVVADRYSAQEIVLENRIELKGLAELMAIPPGQCAALF